MGRIVALTGIAMIAFAANSVLARLALSAPDPNPWAYTGIRLVAGAAMLVLLVWLGGRRAGTPFAIGGSWWAAAALFGYAIAFSIAYLALGAGTGALLLFASVQIGILARAIMQGDRPGPVEWFGFALAFAGLVYLVSPGLVAPDPLGALLMVAAGLCWAAYTLLGRGSKTPLADTMGSFVRCAPFGLALVVIGVMVGRLDTATTAYAVASGALASGIGYAVWYLVLPRLSRTRAAIVQLTVPAIAAAGGVVFIAEPLTLRLLLASAAILGGVAIGLLASERRGLSAR